MLPLVFPFSVGDVVDIVGGGGLRFGYIIDELCGPIAWLRRHPEYQCGANPVRCSSALINLVPSHQFRRT